MRFYEIANRLSSVVDFAVNPGRCSQDEASAMLRMGFSGVAVGIRISPYPPHRSGLADFPHPALASGGDAQTARGIRMADMGRRKPSADESLHTLPLDASLLAPPFERVMPEVTDREAEVSQCVPVARHSEVSKNPTLLPIRKFPAPLRKH